MEDLDLFQRLRRLMGRRDIRDALRELDEGEAVAWDALRQELGLEDGE